MSIERTGKTPTPNLPSNPNFPAMHIAVITKSASNKSGARVPFELSAYLAKNAKVTVFARSEGADKKIDRELAKKKVGLIKYAGAIDLYRKLNGSKCDVVSFHATLPELIAARLAGSPIIKTYYGTQFDAYLEKFLPDEQIGFSARLINKFFNGLIWLDQKAQLLLSDKVIAISQACQAEILKLYKTKSRVVYLGTLFNSPNGMPNRRSLPITFLSVSRITPYKGFHTIAQCVKKLRLKGLNVKLIIAGKPEKKDYLNFLEKTLEVPDEIITDIDDKKLASLYKTSHVYVSFDKNLFFGLPVLEASTFGLPCIVLKNNAAKEHVENGIVGFAVNNEEEFLEGLQKLIASPKLRQKMGEAAQKKAKLIFDWEKIAGQYLKILSLPTPGVSLAASKHIPGV